MLSVRIFLTHTHIILCLCFCFGGCSSALTLFHTFLDLLCHCWQSDRDTAENTGWKSWHHLSAVDTHTCTRSCQGKYLGFHISLSSNHLSASLNMSVTHSCQFACLPVLIPLVHTGYLFHSPTFPFSCHLDTHIMSTDLRGKADRNRGKEAETLTWSRSSCIPLSHTSAHHWSRVCSESHTARVCVLVTFTSSLSRIL